MMKRCSACGGVLSWRYTQARRGWYCRACEDAAEQRIVAVAERLRTAPPPPPYQPRRGSIPAVAIERTDEERRRLVRRRLQARQCAACGQSTRSGRGGRAPTICRPCWALGWRYCSAGEHVVRADVVERAGDRDAARRPTRASFRCRDCKVAREQQRVGRKSRAEEMARRQTIRHPLLAPIIRLYRAGRTLQEIAERLGVKRAAVGAIIRHARMTGRWPEGLVRIPGKTWTRRSRHDDV